MRLIVRQSVTEVLDVFRRHVAASLTLSRKERASVFNQNALEKVLLSLCHVFAADRIPMQIATVLLRENAAAADAAAALLQALCCTPNHGLLAADKQYRHLPPPARSHRGRAHLTHRRSPAVGGALSAGARSVLAFLVTLQPTAQHVQDLVLKALVAHPTLQPPCEPRLGLLARYSG
jgi:hypothetical protein